LAALTACRVGSGAPCGLICQNLVGLWIKPSWALAAFTSSFSRLFLLSSSPSQPPRPAPTLLLLLSQVTLQSRKCLTQITLDGLLSHREKCAACHPPSHPSPRSPSRDTDQCAYPYLPIVSQSLRVCRKIKQSQLEECLYATNGRFCLRSRKYFLNCLTMGLLSVITKDDIDDVA
jgi:hypothetical protein